MLLTGTVQLSLGRHGGGLIISCSPSQNVPLSALTPGHTLKNLLTLVTHTQLGRYTPTRIV